MDLIGDDAVTLTPADLVMVLLIKDRHGGDQVLPTLEIREIAPVVRVLAARGIRAVKLFASSDRRDAAGSAGRVPGGLMAKAIQEVKSADPNLTIITETCLCSHTDTGECHLTGLNGKPDLPGTIEALAEQGVVQAEAGADIVGPAAMVGGSVRAVRMALNDSGHRSVDIMPHVIFSSRLYERYRWTMNAVPASGGRRQLHADPARPGTATKAALAYVSEGADMLLLEPALFSVDILAPLKEACAVPVVPFSVSGEYARLVSGDGDQELLTELFLMLKRAGASMIITYAAADLAATLR